MSHCLALFVVVQVTQTLRLAMPCAFQVKTKKKTKQAQNVLTQLRIGAHVLLNAIIHIKNRQCDANVKM